MLFEQYQLPCLSLSSYLIADDSTRRAVIVDPQRDISQYLAAADEHALEITHVLLTHFHADYVSGHLELAAATGAEIAMSAVAQAEFPLRGLADGERIVLGDVVVEAWQTPGHTPESATYLVYEHAADAAPSAVLTGDTLFVNDVGRPDLLGAIGFTAEQLGAQLYDSVHRLIALPDRVKVYPGHGAGSACGKQLGSEPFTTIGEQKAANYALQPMTKERFIDLVTEGQPAAPDYFLHDAITNRSAHDVFDESRPLVALSLTDAIAKQAEGYVVVDARDPLDFAMGHLRDAVNIPLDGRFAEQAGMVVPADADVVLACEPGKEREAMIRLGRIGFDRAGHHVEDYVGQLGSHPDLVVASDRILAADVARLDRDAVQLLDVRNPGETAGGVIPGAIEIPLGALARRVDELDRTRAVVVYCASGVRSSVAASWLIAHGFGGVSDVIGGYEGWRLLGAAV
jgi:glyoxylase-like metal-dependent hydrolase (beta-lactamase superfamily II)/rhodanese-related sulfurtransferase